MPTTGERFERAVSIMARLRGPGGCPWDREQTFDSIKPYTLEETYEVLDAIDNRDWNELTGELGDLLLQVLFYAQMAKDQGTFSIDEVLDRLSKKLVDRHPHVFGDVKVETSSDVLRNWEALKAEEKKKRRESLDNATGDEKHDGSPESVLAGISSAMPALLEAHKLSSRAANLGFDWPNVEGLFEKLHEETEELREQLRDYPAWAASAWIWCGWRETTTDSGRPEATPRGRSWRPALCAGEYRPLSVTRPRVGTAEDQPQV
jgi:MazG family protein